MWNEFILVETHRNDLLRMAAQRRMVRQAMAGREQRRRYGSLFLSQVGKRMVVLGLILQERYGAGVKTRVETTRAYSEHLAGGQPGAQPCAPSQNPTG